MPTKAFAKFKKTIIRCEELVSTYETLHLQHQQNQEIPAPKDMIRAAVVLAVAALDAYATDVFSEKLVQYLKSFKPDQSLINLLNEAGLDTKEALYLITMERPYRRIRTLINNYYSTYTTQRFEVIDKLFLHYRLKDITKNAASISGKKHLKSSVEKLIMRRHEIVHSGDYNSYGKITSIDSTPIKKRISHLEELVVNMDKLICKRINK